MVLNNIENLLKKYENGETTLNEEQQLKNYFSKDTVEPHLEMYKPMFAYFLVNQQEQFTKDVPLKTKRIFNYKWLSVAAVTVLMFGFYFNQGPTEKEKQDALLAYNQTMEVFDMVALQFNKGKSHANVLSLTSSNLNKGVKHINYIGEFSKTTNKFLKK